MSKKGFDIRLHQERGQHRDGAVSVCIGTGGDEVQRQKKVKTSQGKSPRKEIHQKRC